MAFDLFVFQGQEAGLGPIIFAGQRFIPLACFCFSQTLGGPEAVPGPSKFQVFTLPLLEVWRLLRVSEMRRASESVKVPHCSAVCSVY